MSYSTCNSLGQWNTFFLNLATFYFYKINRGLSLIKVRYFFFVKNSHKPTNHLLILLLFKIHITKIQTFSILRNKYCFTCIP